LTGPARREDTIRARGRTGAALLVLLVLIVLGRTFVATPVRISSGSMTPTLQPGDVVLVDRRPLEQADLRRGDLVTFRQPGTGPALLKRLVGLPGDTVVMLDGVLHVNGKPVDEPYVDFSEWEGMFTARVVVPRGHLYVLGDNRASSVDSRDFGAVPVQAVDGRVVLRLWPPLRRGPWAP
jgi:signal peptidase I